MLSFLCISLYQERLTTAQFTAQFHRRISANMDIAHVMMPIQDAVQHTQISAVVMKNIKNGQVGPGDVSFIRSQFIMVNNSYLPLAYLFVPEKRTAGKKEPPVTTSIVVQRGKKVVGMDNSAYLSRDAVNNTRLDFLRYDLARFSLGKRPEIWNGSTFVKKQQDTFKCPIGLCFEADLTPSAHGIPKIPRIIHQTWVNASVPEITVKWIKKWLEINPGYQYWLWTDRGIDNFISTKYSEYQTVFKKYRRQIEIADAIRYFILYHYGGIYADLDMEPLQSFDPLVFSYPCLLSVEPDEHALLLRPHFANHMRILTSNAIMMCRPKHAFFKHIISGLPARTFLGGTLWRTGPAGMSKDFQTYLSFNRNDLCNSPDNRVAVTSSELLLPQFDSKETRKVKGFCRTKKYARKGLRPIVCKKLFDNKFRNVVMNGSFSTHHWMHSWTPRGKNYKEGAGAFVPIKNIIPRVRLPYDAMANRRQLKWSQNLATMPQK
jgi:hypothetical protein